MNGNDLAGLHSRLRDSHLELSKLHKSADEVFGTLRACMEKVAMDDDSRDEVLDGLDSYGALHKQFAEHHSKEADYHGRQASDATKSASADGLSKVHVFPLDFESIAPRENLTMIPRSGQPPARTDLERAAVPEEFKALLNFD